MDGLSPGNTRDSRPLFRPKYWAKSHWGSLEHIHTCFPCMSTCRFVRRATIVFEAQSKLTRLDHCAVEALWWPACDCMNTDRCDVLRSAVMFSVHTIACRPFPLCHVIRHQTADSSLEHTCRPSFTSLQSELANLSTTFPRLARNLATDKSAAAQSEAAPPCSLDAEVCLPAALLVDPKHRHHTSGGCQQASVTRASRQAECVHPLQESIRDPDRRGGDVCEQQAQGGTGSGHKDSSAHAVSSSRTRPADDDAPGVALLTVPVDVENSVVPGKPPRKSKARADLGRSRQDSSSEQGAPSLPDEGRGESSSLSVLVLGSRNASVRDSSSPPHHMRSINYRVAGPDTRANDKKRDGDHATLCSVCEAATGEWTLLPCRHVHACARCAGEVMYGEAKRCPLCMMHVHSMDKVGTPQPISAPSGMAHVV